MNEATAQKAVSYLQINHELNESLAVMHFVHGCRPCGRCKLQLYPRSNNACCQSGFHRGCVVFTKDVRETHMDTNNEPCWVFESPYVTLYGQPSSMLGPHPSLGLLVHASVCALKSWGMQQTLEWCRSCWVSDCNLLCQVWILSKHTFCF